MENNVISIIEEQLKGFIQILRPTDVEVCLTLDQGYNLDRQIALLFKIRPKWDDPSIVLRYKFAELNYVKNIKVWKLYLQRSSGKWELCEPFLANQNLEMVLNEIIEDDLRCLFR
ncbi:hypothetical protein ACVWYN_001708 [Pedobacter sp. UYP24]